MNISNVGDNEKVSNESRKWYLKSMIKGKILDFGLGRFKKE